MSRVSQKSKMSDINESSSEVKEAGEREIPPWAHGTTLRNVERDVLVPKIMREKAKVRCKDVVDGRYILVLIGRYFLVVRPN